MFRIVQKDKGHLCQAHGCTNKKRIERGVVKDRFCSKHRHRYAKAKDPVRYTFNLLKSNAKARKKKFTITLCYFRIWCLFNNYMDEKGKSPTSASIDRDDPLKGYEIGNMKKLSLANNTRKMHEDKDLPF